MNGSDRASAIQPVWYGNFRTICLALGLASLGLLSLHWFMERHNAYSQTLTSFLLKEAGMAGLIALVLNLSIEWVNRRRHQDEKEQLLAELRTNYDSARESLLHDLEQKHRTTSAQLLSDVTKRLFQTVYERNVDPEVFRQVDKHLLKAVTMRREFRADFRLRRHVDPNSQQATDRVLMHHTSAYKLVNLSDKPEEAAVVRAMVDLSPDHADQCRFVRVSVNGQCWTQQELIDQKLVVNRGNFLHLEIVQTIKPDDPINVLVEYIKIAPLNYNEIVITTVPMDGIELQVVDPEEAFEIEAVSLHPAPEEAIGAPGDKTLNRWRIDQAILPGQGIVMIWRPRAPRSAAPSTAPVAHSHQP